MGCCCKKFILFSLILSALSIGYFTFLHKPTFELPADVYDDHYWGSTVLKDGQPLPKDDTTLRPLKVSFDEEVLKDLHSRLDKTRFVKPLQANFEDGFNGDYLKKLVSHWRHNFDWKKQVAFLNQHPQFTTQIEGLTIHFVRIKPTVKSKIVKPILLVNGWPSNPYMMYKLAELLAKPVNDVSFEVVLVSRPGYGFSEQPSRPGLGISDSARIYVKLMKRLGYEKFYYHGEDWGAIEGHALTVLYPNSVDGVHFSMGMSDLGFTGLTKMFIGKYLPNLVYSSESEAKTFEDPMGIFSGIAKEFGYFLLQATKPDTIGALLMDSPAGLAAYYLEKFSTGLNKDFIYLPDGGLTKKFSLDELLTNIMIYWTTGNGAYSSRYYKEHLNKAFAGFDITKFPSDDKVPVGFSVGENELAIGKMKPVGKYNNILKHDYLPDVGHFPAFENPTAVNEHLRKFVSLVMDYQKKNEQISSKNEEL